MSNLFQNMNLSCNSFNISNINNSALLQDLYRHLFPCQNMLPYFNLPECSFTNTLADDVMANGLCFLIILKRWASWTSRFWDSYLNIASKLYTFSVKFDPIVSRSGDNRGFV